MNTFDKQRSESNPYENDYPNWGGIQLDDASKAILMYWYSSAQNRVFGENGRTRKKIEIVVSDDEDEKPVYEWAQKEVVLSQNSKKIAVAWLRDARAKLQRKRGWETDIKKSNYWQKGRERQ